MHAWVHVLFFVLFHGPQIAGKFVNEQVMMSLYLGRARERLLPSCGIVNDEVRALKSSKRLRHGHLTGLRFILLGTYSAPQKSLAHVRATGVVRGYRGHPGWRVSSML